MTESTQIQWLETVDSTNSWLKKNISSCPVACASLQQKNGRGRLGRQWDGKQGEMLALSIVQKAPATPIASLIAGCAVQKAISNLTNVTCMLKWPNDLLINGKKICGILCEGCVQNQKSYIIIGIGINLEQSIEHFLSQNLPHASSLKVETQKDVDAKLLAEEIVQQWQELWEQYSQNGFACFKQQYEQYCINLEREICVMDAQGSPLFKGTGIGVTNEGMLQVQTEDGIKLCNAGEVSVRGIYGYGE